jgi:hypothetical protein
MSHRPAATSRVLARVLAALTALAPLPLVSLSAGCGSSGYQWETTYRRDIRTVAVPIFRNKSFRRGDEFALTRALVQEIEARTPYKVTDREKADTIIEGEIQSISVNNLSQDTRAAIPQEQLYTVTLNFVWKDLRSGQILVDRQNFQYAVNFFPTLGEGRETGRQLNAEELAGAIVKELEADW